MQLIGAIIALIQSILDRLPSRQESVFNRIQDIKDEIKTMQFKSDKWTANDSGKYYALLNELQNLESRSSNFGK